MFIKGEDHGGLRTAPDAHESRADGAMLSTQTQASVKYPFHRSRALSGPLNTHLNIYVFTFFTC